MEIVLADPPRPLQAGTPPEEAPEWLPLSFAQQRLWFLDRLHPNSPAYNVPMAWRLRGPLDASALGQSLGAIVARHEILRTVYAPQDGEPRQQVRPPGEFNLETIDLTKAPVESEGPLTALLLREAARPFDLAGDLMLRAKLFKLSEQAHILFLTAHHIAFDEWSMQILWRELEGGYEAFLDGHAPQFDELPIQYADFAIWQRESASGWAGEEQYWRERLAGPLPRVELPSARPRGAERGERGARENLTLPRELAGELRTFARREGVTMHVLLMAAFQALLRRHCPHDDIVIGTPVAGRAHFQTEPLIGFFVNTLPVRVSFAGQPTFHELLARTRQASLEACEHQEVPFDRLVEAARIARPAGGNPIFDVVFSTQHGEPPRRLGGLAAEAIELETGTAKFELTFVARDHGEELAFTAEYSAELFDAAPIRQMLAGYEATLRAIIADPEAPVASLSLPEAAAAPAGPAVEVSNLRRPGAEPDLPPTRLQKKLRNIWKNVLGHDSFGPADNFFEVGGHSLLAVKLIAQIEKGLGKSLALPILFKAPTIEKLAAALAGENGPAMGSCLVEIQPAGAKPPVFWLHTLGGGGGGGLFTYRKLAEELGPDQPSYGFVASGQPFDRIEAMAARYIEEMRAVQPAGPYRLGGYCFGGVVAYEMARQLEAAGERVGALALLDSSPPDPIGERTRPSLRLVWHALTSLPAWLGQLDAGAVKRISVRLRARLDRRKKAQAAKTEAPQLEQFVDMTHYPADYKRFALAHWSALMRYQPGPYRGPATLFKTDERHLFHLDSLGAWRKLTGPGLQVRRVTGKHEQILEPPHVQKLAAQLRELLV